MLIQLESLNIWNRGFRGLPYPLFSIVLYCNVMYIVPILAGSSISETIIVL
jgi:hypothetical protein